MNAKPTFIYNYKAVGNDYIDDFIQVDYLFHAARLVQHNAYVLETKQITKF